VGTTLGAGIFSLPYAFAKAGVAVGSSYLLVLSGFVIFSHYLYYRALEKKKGKTHLLGLVEELYGKIAARAAFIFIIVGLFLTLAAYLVLGTEFILLAFPRMHWVLGLLILWFLSSLPFLEQFKRFLKIESWGTFLLVSVIALILFAAPRNDFYDPGFNSANFFLPFGAVLFSLAGWTCLEPVYSAYKKARAKRGAILPLAAGTVFVAAIYLLFSIAIIGSSSPVTSDSISGISSWPKWLFASFGIMGFLAIWTSYLPIGLEIKDSFERDLEIPRWISLGLVLLIPLYIALSGKSFLSIVELAGGVFLSGQYVLLLLVSKKILRPNGVKALLLNAVFIIFLAATFLEIYGLLN
jgi:amino acid permease